LHQISNFLLGELTPYSAPPRPPDPLAGGEGARCPFRLRAEASPPSCDSHPSC